MAATRVLLAGFVVVVSLNISSAQDAATNQVMRDKLQHSQNILAAIMTSDAASLDKESAALMRATELPAWSTFKSPEYLRQSAAFIRAIQDLRDSAKSRDMDAAALNYVSLTITCLQCHRHLKGVRNAD